ncbi:MAG: serine/threonine-protein kinase [Rikenellaceae bacterium]
MSSSEFFTTPIINSAYSDLKFLHESGFNTLYKAEREGKIFIVKALSEPYRGNMLYESLLRKEFEIGYSLDHPNICRTVGYDEFDDVGNAVIMEWIDGRTLDKYIAEGQHAAKELVRIVEQLCAAMSYTHKRQTIHRDLKPQNIIVTYNGDNVKLLDFGLSDTDHHAVLKEPAGSRRYASPELLAGDKVDSRSDVYSLGVIINELFAAEQSRRVAKVVSRATAFNPSARYADVEAVATALKGRPTKLFYPILAVMLLAMIYLFFMLNRATESLIPSAQADGVTSEEFERRQVLCNDFYQEVNNGYLELMNDRIYRMSCATPEMPDFDELSQRQLTHYKRVLDSMLCDIKQSSLYLNARRNASSHNSELFTLMRTQFPAMFWLNTEQLYRSATDSLASQLKQLPAPDIASNYQEMSYEEQQAENSRYQQAVQSYKKATVEVWAVEYRKMRNLQPIPAQLLNYYESK